MMRLEPQTRVRVADSGFQTGSAIRILSAASCKSLPHAAAAFARPPEARRHSRASRPILYCKDISECGDLRLRRWKLYCRGNPSGVDRAARFREFLAVAPSRRRNVQVILRRIGERTALAGRRPHELRQSWGISSVGLPRSGGLAQTMSPRRRSTGQWRSSRAVRSGGGAPCLREKTRKGRAVSITFADLKSPRVDSRRIAASIGSARAAEEKPERGDERG